VGFCIGLLCALSALIFFLFPEATTNNASIGRQLGGWGEVTRPFTQ
jgi:hypothetical protein